MKKRILVLTGSPRIDGNSDLLAEAFINGTIETYKSIADYQKWTNKGILAVPSVSAKGDIKNTSALPEAEKLGGGGF